MLDTFQVIESYPTFGLQLSSFKLAGLRYMVRKPGLGRVYDRLRWDNRLSRLKFCYMEFGR